MSTKANKRIRLANKLLSAGHIDEVRHERFIHRVVNRECARINDGIDLSIATRTNGAD